MSGIQTWTSYYNQWTWEVWRWRFPLFACCRWAGAQGNSFLEKQWSSSKPTRHLLNQHLLRDLFVQAISGGQERHVWMQKRSVNRISRFSDLSKHLCRACKYSESWNLIGSPQTFFFSFCLEACRKSLWSVSLRIRGFAFRISEF